MHIAVFGCGFVGGTVANFLESCGVAVSRVDPVLYPGVDPYDAIFENDGIIICVPTPSAPDGTCDDSIVQQILEMADYRTKILLKSTVTFDCLRDYEPNVVYSPEFLREASAKEDFENQEQWIFGHHENNHKDAVWWNDLFAEAQGHDLNTVYCSTEEASMIKYAHNAFLATKVAWFHELYANMPMGIDYETVTAVLGNFRRIGPDMMKAPNAEGKLGFGGHCFPKDVKALTKVIDHSILEQVKKTNEALSMQKTVTIKQLDDSDELFFELTDEMMEALGAKIGDSIEWINNNDGSWTIQKVTKKDET
jgi:UDPglucose 6-dehydrogenase